EPYHAHTIITPTYRHFDKFDYDYWTGRYKIPLTLANFFDVRADSKVHMVKKSGDERTCYEIAGYNPMYSYQIDDKFKIYRPFSPDKKYKWLSNTRIDNIQGMKQLPERGELLIITSSLKDCMVLRVLGYYAIAPMGEGMIIPEHIM